MISTNFTRHLVFLFLLFCQCYSAHAQFNPQVTTTNMGYGNVQYNTSGCTDHALRFFIFDDGIYSFENDPRHHYPPSNLGHNAKVWFSEPYDYDPPTFRAAPLSGPTDTGLDENPVIYMATNPIINTSWSICRNKEHFYMLVFRNTGYTPYSGCVDFYYNSFELNLNVPGILEHNNWVTNRVLQSSNVPNYDTMIKWDFSNLGPNETRIVYIPMTAKLPVGSKIKTASRVRIGCVNGGALIVKENEVKATPHDPNNKTADRDCSDLPNSGEPMNVRYKINFKNIGSGYANNVVVKDTLATYFDVTSLSMQQSEFPYTYSVNGRILTVNFIGINLPGTKQTIPFIHDDNQTESWFNFSICTRRNAPLPSKGIENIATIYFDNLPGIRTNLSKMKLEPTCPVVYCNNISPRLPGSGEAQIISLSPNPASGFTTLNAYSELPAEISIYTSNAAMVKQLKLDRLAGENKIDLSELPTGLYFIKVKSAEINVSLKFIKIE
jgi:uncharacterized repeat protein (TIGR01451 family)